jgi:hypothetical protein
MTWLNAINDQAFGIRRKTVAGTDRDCLHALDLFYGSGTANLPEVLVHRHRIIFGYGLRDRAASRCRLPAGAG